jgi:mannitol/fructose-specific phosphotransferase system IIA component (Ntr-type)
MKLSEYVEPNLVVTELEPGDVRDILLQLVTPLVEDATLTSTGPILEALIARERVLSTGIGQGIAVPHAISESVPSTRLIIGVSSSGVDYNAIYVSPVYVFFVLISPVERLAKSNHIKLLARIARLARHPAFVDMLKECSVPQEVVGSIEEYEREHV